MSVEISITDQIVEINEVSNPVEISVSAGAAVAQWGNITGTLSNQTDLQNALNLKVPYTGATANVDLGEFELKAGQIEYDQTPTGTAGVAVTRWNDSTGTIETTLKGGSVVLEHGRDMFERVVNKTGIQLTKAAYQAVRVSNAQGQRLAVQLAQANNDNNSADTIGLVVETIDNNQEGYIYTVGEIDGVNTTGSLQGETWVDGDVLYLSPTTAGRITNIKPLAPQHLVVIGYVVYAHQNNGKIYIKITNGFELGELHDVSTIGATNGQVLKYNGTIWTPSGDVGITSLNGLTATTQTFSLDTRGNDVAIVSSGSNHEFIFPSASATRRGVLTSADWSLFFNKIGGSGTIGTMPIFTGTGAIGNSIVNITNGLVNIDGVGNLSDYALQIGTGRTNNGFAYIDLVGDATYSDYGFRLMRNNTGANATSVLEHRGTGDFIFKTVDNANLYLQTGSTNRVFVEANSGALNVANTSAVFLANTGEQLIVNGSAKFASSVTANSLVKTGGTSTQYLMADGSTSTLTNPVTGTGVSGQVAYWSGTGTQTGSNNLIFDGSRLGIARTPAARRLEIQVANGSTAAALGIYEGGGTLYSIIGLDSNTVDLQIASREGLRFYSGSTFGNIVTNPTNERMRLFGSTGNLAIGGTFASDSGQRLQVTGDTLMKGSGNTSATTALTVQDSASTNLLRILNDGTLKIGTQNVDIFPTANGSTVGTAGRGLIISTSTGTQTTGAVKIVGASTLASGSDWSLWLSHSFAPASGTATHSGLLLNQTINQTGGANGITRGLYLNPTLTAAADWRSIEWSNNTGWGLRGEGTANNYLGGRLGLGSTNLTFANFRVSNVVTGGVNSSAIFTDSVIQSDVTNSGTGFYSGLSTAAASFTLSNLRHFIAEAGTFGAGSTITNQYGFVASSNLTGATNNYGFFASIPSGTNRWNFYANGSALNYMNGALLLGSTTSSGEQLQVTGTMKVTGTSSLGGNVSLLLTQNAATRIAITNVDIGVDAKSEFVAFSRNGGITKFGRNSILTTAYKILNASDGYVLNETLGDFAILNDNASGSIKMAAGGSSTAQVTLAANGNITQSVNQNAVTSLTISNTTDGTTSGSAISLTSDAASGTLTIGKRANLRTAYKILGGADAQIYNSSGADISILNDAATGQIKMAAGGSSTAHFTIKSNGRINMSSLPTSSTGLSAGDLWNDAGTLKIV